VTAAAEALARIIAAPTPRRMEAAATLAFACGASMAEVEWVRGLWERARRCVACDHAASVHDASIDARRHCWYGHCECTGFVSPDREDPQP
jgi:hypothetical protein